MAAAAKTMDEPDAEAEAAAPVMAAKPRLNRKVIIAAAAVIAIAAGAGGFMLMRGSSAHTAEKSEPAAEAGAAHEEHGSPAASSGNSNYLELSPPFVVNLSDDEANRYLQVDMQVLAHDSHSVDDIKTHLPRIRNGVLLLLGQQHYFDINTREGKEKLQAAVLGEIKKIMTEQTGKPGVDAVYFTSFVMQ